MRPEEHDLKYLWDMLDAAKSIQEFVSGVTWSHYTNNKLLQAGVERKKALVDFHELYSQPDFVIRASGHSISTQ